MTQIKTLPLFPGAKFIVIDDGEDVIRAETLILGWLRMWNEKGLGNTVEFLLFSGPTRTYEEYTEDIRNVDIKFHDYYTITNDDKDDTERDIQNLESIVNGNILQVNSVVIVDCLSALTLSVGLSRTLRFVEKLSSRCAQMIAIYRRDFCRNRIPRIETLGTTYLRVAKPSSYVREEGKVCYEVFLNHRKQGGGILNHRAQVFHEIASNEIVKEIEIPNHDATEMCSTPPCANKKPQASFRIEMNAREQAQRKNTPLPYGAGVTTQNESQILYEHDSIDDVDEEDPDDDLPF